MKYHLFILQIIFSICKISSIIPINEFEEIEIVNNPQILLFNNIYTEELDYNPEIIINCFNNHFLVDQDSKIIISKSSKKSFILSSDNTLVLSRNDKVNEGKGEYKLIFTNYIGGKITIFNSIHPYPLKNFNKLFYLWSSSIINSNFIISMFSDILVEDIYLNIRGGISNLKIEKIKDNIIEEEYSNINATKLYKGYTYNFTYNITTNSNLFLFLNKREINLYNKSNYEKVFFPSKVPIYYMINLEEFNISFENLYFFAIIDENGYFSIEIEIAEINDIIKEEELEAVQFLSKKYISHLNSAISFSDIIINTNKILIKLTPGYHYYSFFHIFEDYIDISEPKKIVLEPRKEILLSTICKNKLTLFISNNTNIKSFENFEVNNYAYRFIDKDYVYLERFCIFITPSVTPTNISMDSLTINVWSLNLDFSLKNFLFPYFKNVKNSDTIWVFNSNKNSIVNLKTYFGNPSFYYSNNFGLIKSFSTDLTGLNYCYDGINIKGPFFLYIFPNDYTFVDILISDMEYEQNINFIIYDNALKYLKENVEYNLMNIEENIIRLEINRELNKNIKIIDQEDNLKYILNKANSYIDLDQSFNNFKIISEEDTYINIYHNITEIFSNEIIFTIELTKEDIEKGIIINITNLETIKIFNYSIFYGYKELIPSNLKKLSYMRQYLYINNDIDKFGYLEENKNFYIYIFGEESSFTINYINTYKLNTSKLYNKINPKKDYYFLTEKNYYDFYKLNYHYAPSNFEIFFCRNDFDENPMNVTIIDANGKEEKIIIKTDYYNYYSDSKLMIHFDYNYEFILISQEKYSKNIDNILNIYVPDINETNICILIKSKEIDKDVNYTIVIIEENEDGEEIFNKLNNPCYFFQLLDKDNNLSLEYNNIITYASSKKYYFIFEEIDITKFNKNKNLYVKILYYSEHYQTIFYSKTKKIFIENIIQENKYDFDADYILNNKEYSISNNKYMFKYNIKKNHLGIFPTIFLTYYNTYNLEDINQELEIIDPLLQNITYKLVGTNQITLSEQNTTKEYGDYYFIFRNALGIKFYIHNTINIFSLNEIPYYISYSNDRATDSIIYFSLKLNKPKYIMMNIFNYLYLYSKTKKTTKFITSNAQYINLPPDDYLILDFYEGYYFSYYFYINTDIYLIDNEIPISKEITSVEYYIGPYNIMYTKETIIDLNSYEIKPYIILGNYNDHYYTCCEYKNIDDIMKRKTIFYQNIKTDYHIINLTNIICPNNKPYIEIRFSNTVFEFITDYRIIRENKDFNLISNNETIAFDIRVPNDKINYIFVFSNNENLQDLDKTNLDATKIIFNKSNYYQFKLLANEKEKETELKIRMFEYSEGIEINTIKENEISDLFFFENNNTIIKYYINLLKKDVLFNYYELSGESEWYLSKDEVNIDNTVIEKILNKNSIQEEIFSLQNNNEVIIKPYQIIAIKYNSKKTIHYLYMSSLYQDFLIYNPIKSIKANKKYLLKKGVKIASENNNNSTIKLSSYDNKNNYVINKLCNTFENFGENLILEADKDTTIYLFYNISKELIELNNNIIIFKKDYPKNTVLLFFSSEGDIYYGFTLDKNYKSWKKNLNKYLTNNKYAKFYYPYSNNYNKSSFDIELYIYSQIESDFYIQYNFSFVLNSLKISDKYMSQVIYNKNTSKKYFYYQYKKCGNSSENIEELFVIFNNNYMKRLYYTDLSSIYYDNIEEMYFIYHSNNSAFLNIYLSEYNYNDNSQYSDFDIFFGSRNEIKIKMKPYYSLREADYYFIYTIQNKSEESPELDNICYVQGLIYENNNSNIYITKQVLSGYYYIDISIKTSEKLLDDLIIYINILAKKTIFEEFTNYIIYKSKSHIIKGSDFPKNIEEENNDNGTSSTTLSLIIVFSILGAIILFFFIFFLYRYYNKKRKLNNKSEIYKENVGEVMLKSETNNN